MQIKSGLLRHITATAELWQVDTAWVFSDGHARIALGNKSGSMWLSVTLEGLAPVVEAQFSIDDLRKALLALRGNVDILLTPVSLAIGAKIIPLKDSSIITPSISAEHTVRIDGHAWTTFFEKAKKYAWNSTEEKFSGILVDGTGQTTALVACDRFRLFYYDTGLPGNSVRVMMPRELCEAWQTLDPFDIGFSHEYVVLSTASETLLGRIQPAVFPDYQNLLEIGDKTVTFKGEDIEFIRKSKAQRFDALFKENSIYFEWIGPWGDPEQSGDKKIPASCTVTGKETFTRTSLLPLLDAGENITVATHGIKQPYVTNIGGLVYVFKGSD